MKIYRVNFNDTYCNTDYIIAANNIGEAYAFAMQNETGTLLDGTVVDPTLECFSATLIEGVFSKVAGIKAKFNH